MIIRSDFTAADNAEAASRLEAALPKGATVHARVGLDPKGRFGAGAVVPISMPAAVQMMAAQAVLKHAAEAADACDCAGCLRVRARLTIINAILAETLGEIPEKAEVVGHA